MHRLLLPLLLLAVLALVAAGCGGSSEDDARALLRETFGEAEPVRSGRLDLRLKVDAEGVTGLDRGLSVALSGPFQSRGRGRTPQFDLSVVVDAGDTALRAGAVSTGGKGWLKLQDRAYTLSDDIVGQLRSQGDVRSQADGIDLKRLGVDPARWLREPERVGEEQLAGTPTVHVRGGVEVARMLDDVAKLLERAGSLGASTGAQVPAQLGEEQRRKVVRSVEEATVDVWTGAEDRQLRRVLVDVRFDVPEEVRGRDRPAQRGTVRFDLRIDELNRRQAIRPPADPRPLSELQRALGALAQAAQQQRGTQPAAPQGGTGTSAYAQCLQEAADDLAAQQRCASLLGR